MTTIIQEVIMTHLKGNQFRSDEIVCLRHFNQKTSVWTESDYPKVGGRLRLAHEVNGHLDINTDIIQYDGTVAVVRAVITSEKGSFSGIGMASVERDAKLAPAILELAETRAIARSLRFAGFGVEYCSAEEISHLEHETPPLPPEKTYHQPQEKPSYQSPPPRKTQPEDRPRNGNGQGVSGGNGENGNNNNGRISQKQHSFLVSLAEDRHVGRKELDDMSRERFGVVVSYLSKADASSFIGELTSN
jgi:hypothetical protein